MDAMPVKVDKLITHPAADLFPMLTKQELQELADDIKAHGQREPIQLSSDGKTILDGRNRLAACKIAKVEPIFSFLDVENVEAWIISMNIARRHLNAGQRAMVVARLHPEPDGKRGTGAKSLTSKNFPMVNSGTLAIARRILRQAPDLVTAVLNGSMPFDKAAREAKDREDLMSSTENKINLLREGAADLVDLVKENRMDIDEAIAAMKERERKERETLETGRSAAEVGLSRFLADVASIVAAVKLAQAKSIDTKIIDRKRVDAVVKAADQLNSVVARKG